MTAIETKINELARRLRETEEELESLRRLVSKQKPKPFAPLTPLDDPRPALRAAGLLREPTDLELQAAARWEKRSKKDRQRIRAVGRALKLTKPVSEIILESRIR